MVEETGGRETRSTYTEEIFDVVNANSLEEVFAQEARNINIVIEDIEKYIEELKSSTEAGEFKGTRKELEDAIFAKAFLDCVEVIEDKALNFLITEAVKATVATQEFNYDLYVQHLLGAMEANKKSLIGIIPRKQKRQVEVKINAHFLGKPEEWGKAIEAYREQRKLGKVSKQNKDVGSKIWKEKIYGVGREGGQVKRFYKKKDSNVDVTDKYKNLYRETVEGRLANLDDDKAPFWYLIEHGNAIAGKKLKLDTDGVPYPSFGKTKFVSNSEKAIASAFAQIWTQYEEAARDVIENLEDKRVRALREEAEERVEAGILPEEGALISEIEIEEGNLVAFNQTWGVQVSLRNPKSGQFAPLPRGR